MPAHHTIRPKFSLGDAFSGQPRSKSKRICSHVGPNHGGSSYFTKRRNFLQTVVSWIRLETSQNLERGRRAARNLLTDEKDDKAKSLIKN